MAEAKTCLECNDPIKGRADKKFCSDQCRNTYNNQLNSDENAFVRNTNNGLRKNRRILAEVLKGKTENKGVTNLKSLSKEGFNFDLMTSIYVTKNNDSYYFSYEFGYKKLENDRFMVVRKA